MDESCFANVLIERMAKAVQSHVSGGEAFLGVEEVLHFYADKCLVSWLVCFLVLVGFLIFFFKSDIGHCFWFKYFNDMKNRCCDLYYQCIEGAVR